MSRSESRPELSPRECSPPARAPTCSISAAPAPPTPQAFPRRLRPPTSAARERTGRAPHRRPRSARKSRSSQTTNGTSSSRTQSSCCTSTAPRSPIPPSGKPSGPSSTKSSARSCPRATALAPFRWPATRNRTAPCAGRAPTSSSARSSTRTARSRSSSNSVTSPWSAAWSWTDSGLPGSPSRTSAPGKRHSWQRTSLWWPRMPSAPRSSCGHPACGRPRSATT